MVPNLALTGQFIEVPEDCVFAMECSVRSAANSGLQTAPSRQGANEVQSSAALACVSAGAPLTGR